jgi:ribosomal protein S18 acetylase RimI-like enzyme
MEFKNFEVKYLDEVVNLWNREVASVAIYKPFTSASFTQKFLDNKFFNNAGLKLLFDNDKLIGMGHAIMTDVEAGPGYITFVVVDKEHERQGIGSTILAELEKYLKENGKTLVRLLFFNPTNLEWIIPGTNADHPGAPAIPYNSPFYFLLLASGYKPSAQQDAFYLDITNYSIPQKVIDTEARNEKEGYTITIYDEKLHHGFKELFEELKNPGWYQAVQHNLAKEKPDPMLIVQKEGEILGWTGPMYTQESGRGYFAGIGVHPKTQGLGLGKALFCHLVNESRKNGAKFMTLFTGAENLARNIYLYAGFKIVQSFAVMSKPL